MLLGFASPFGVIGLPFVCQADKDAAFILRIAFPCDHVLFFKAAQHGSNARGFHAERPADFAGRYALVFLLEHFVQ